MNLVSFELRWMVIKNIHGNYIKSLYCSK